MSRTWLLHDKTYVCPWTGAESSYACLSHKWANRRVISHWTSLNQQATKERSTRQCHCTRYKVWVDDRYWGEQWNDITLWSIVHKMTENAAKGSSISFPTLVTIHTIRAVDEMKMYICAASQSSKGIANNVTMRNNPLYTDGRKKIILATTCTYTRRSFQEGSHHCMWELIRPGCRGWSPDPARPHRDPLGISWRRQQKELRRETPSLPPAGVQTRWEQRLQLIQASRVPAGTVAEHLAVSEGGFIRYAYTKYPGDFLNSPL